MAREEPHAGCSGAPLGAAFAQAEDQLICAGACSWRRGSIVCRLGVSLSDDTNAKDHHEHNPDPPAHLATDP